MIIPLNIIVCSLNSVKCLPGDEYDSPVVNTLCSFDSPVMNTPGADFLVYLEQATEQNYKKTFGDK